MGQTVLTQLDAAYNDKDDSDTSCWSLTDKSRKVFTWHSECFMQIYVKITE